MKRWTAIVALTALAACSRQPAVNQATPTPTPTPTPPPTPAATSAQGSAALPAPELGGVTTAPGGWRFQVSGAGDQAVFGVAGQPSQFALRCDAEHRRIVFSRAASGGSGGTMQIVATDGAATFNAAPDAQGRLIASDQVTDTFLTQVLAEAADRIGVKIGDNPTLAMPADPVIGQTIRRCAAPRG
ncbi:MAG: hypothetical protein ACTHMG_00605 [Sphingomonas sp.]